MLCDDLLYILVEMWLDCPVVEQIPTIVGQEDTPQAGSLLPVGLGTICDEHTPTTRIYMINPTIGVNDLVLALSARWV